MDFSYKSWKHSCLRFDIGQWQPKGNFRHSCFAFSVFPYLFRLGIFNFHRWMDLFGGHHRKHSKPLHQWLKVSENYLSARGNFATPLRWGIIAVKRGTLHRKKTNNQRRGWWRGTDECLYQQSKNGTRSNCVAKAQRWPTFDWATVKALKCLF